jgi:hypothetical protein
MLLAFVQHRLTPVTIAIPDQAPRPSSGTGGSMVPCTGVGGGMVPYAVSAPGGMYRSTPPSYNAGVLPSCTYGQLIMPGPGLSPQQQQYK